MQFKPSNANAPVRIGSGHGERCGCDDGHAGTGGDVAQTNLAAALGIALNANTTDQSVEQHQRGGSCKCGGSGVQAAGQAAWNRQDADADANALQFGASNTNGPVGLGSPGGGGSVFQANAALAAALAANLNLTSQEVTQAQR